jgi:hypothetical protein
MRKTTLFLGATLLSFTALLPAAARAHIRSMDAGACQPYNANGVRGYQCGLVGGDDYGVPTTVYFDYNASAGSIVDLYFVRTTYSGSISSDTMTPSAPYTGSYDAALYPSTTIQGPSPYDYYRALFITNNSITVYGVALRN